MSLPIFLAGSTQCNTLIEEAVFTNLSCLAYNNPHAVVYNKTGCYLCSRMDLYAGQKPSDMRQEPRQYRDTGIPENMVDPVKYHGMEPRIRQNHLKPAPGSRVSQENGPVIPSYVNEKSHI